MYYILNLTLRNAIFVPYISTCLVLSSLNINVGSFSIEYSMQNRDKNTLRTPYKNNVTRECLIKVLEAVGIIVGTS